MYELSENKKELTRLEKTDFSSIDLTEKDIEDILVNRIGILEEDENDSDEESGSLLIVGRQVRNEGNGRSDLTAIDKDGNLVLIEIKRDVKDIKSRSESFTFQAIRYVASYSKIKDVFDLADKVYIPFLEKYKTIQPKEGQNMLDLATDKLYDFLDQNKKTELSGKQRIILVAGEFDEQTLSAADRLNKNKIDISCIQLNLFKQKDKIFLDVKKLIPQEDYILEVADMSWTSKISHKINSVKSKARLPKINTLVRENVLCVGDVFEAKNYNGEEVELQSNCLVKIMNTKKESLSVGSIMSMQQWLRKVLEWDAVDTYKFAVVKKSKNSENEGKLIYDIREEWMAEQKMDEN